MWGFSAADEAADLFDSYGDPGGGAGAAYAALTAERPPGAFTSEDIELALQEAEQLVDAGSSSPAHQHQQQQYQQHQQRAERPPSSGGGSGLGEAAVMLRLTLHEKELELLELRAQFSQLADHSGQLQQQLEAGLEERDARIVALETVAGRHEAAASRLGQQLAAYGGVSPRAVARLQADNAALAEGKQAAEQAAADAERRRDKAARRVNSGLATWERVQAELQAENGQLAAEVERQRSELADLYQEKEVLRARAAMLEARAGAAAPTSAAAVLQHPAVHEMREQLAATVERLAGRDAAAKKYKEAVRALKRRTADLEQHLAAKAAAASQAQAGAAQAGAALQQYEQQLTEARQYCEQYGGRLAQVEGQLKKAEFERAQWEWRAQDAEQRAQSASEQAEASSAAAARLADKRRAAAEGRAAEMEAQAKAASLKALQLEKALGSARQELEALRGQHGKQEELSTLHERKLLKQQVCTLRAQLAGVQHRSSCIEQELRNKVAALAAADRKLRQSEVILQRLAQAGGLS